MIFCNSELCQLMVYGSGIIVGIEDSGDGDRGSKIDSADYCLESVDSVLDLLLNLYLELDIFPL